MVAASASPRSLAALVPRVVQAGAGVTVLRVQVVRLPGDVREQEEQIGRLVVADGEGDVRAVAVEGGQDGDVGADVPVGRDLEAPGQPPVVAGDRAVGGERRRLDDPGEPGARGDLAGAVAAVVADAVDVDAEFLRRVDRHMEVDGLAGSGGPRAGEALDLTVDVVGGARASGTGAHTGAGGGPRRRDPGGGRRLRRLGRVGVHVPGDDVAGVVEIGLAAAEPGNGSQAEGIRDGVRECSRLPAADLLRSHARTPPSCPRRTGKPLRRARSVPAHHITHAVRHRSS